jgi:hypothetical protein
VNTSFVQTIDKKSSDKVGWTSVFVHPRETNKNLKVYKNDVVSLSCDSSSFPIQKSPRVKNRFLSKSLADKFFANTQPSWATPFLAAAAALAISTNSAVKIQAAPIISGYLLFKGHKVLGERNPYQFYDANRQALRRHNLPSSAGEIISELISLCGLSGQVRVLLHRRGAGDAVKRSVILAPADSCVTAELATQILEELSFGEKTKNSVELCGSGEFSFWKKAARHFDFSDKKYDNFVDRYMRKNITEDMFKPALDLKRALSFVDTLDYESFYKSSLKSEIVAMYGGGFQCRYRTAENSTRVFGIGSSIQFLPGKIRRAIFPHFLEIDFANMHLALANKHLNLGLDLSSSFWKQLYAAQSPIFSALQDAVSDNGHTLKTAYPEIFEDISGELAFDSRFIGESFVKDQNKTATYAILFGKSPSTQISDTAKNIRAKGADSKLALVIARIICKSKSLIFISEKISQYCAVKGIDAGDLSAEFQALESRYMRKVYAVADRMGPERVRLLIHSHDGASLQLADKPSAKEFFELIKEEVDGQLKNDGVSSKIEAKTASGSKIDIENILDSDLVYFNSDERIVPLRRSTIFFVCLGSVFCKTSDKWTLSTGPPGPGKLDFYLAADKAA